MTIDLTDRYNKPEYMLPRTDWTVDRVLEPVRALVIHHIAGWYGPVLGFEATEAEEIVQLDLLAADHHARFGIGPGYYYAAFPSARLYAIGKYGTHRAHVLGHNPETANWWNREAMAIVAFGDYQANSVPGGLWAAIVEGIQEIRGYTDADLMLYGHREVPSDDPGTTSCPGDNLMACLGEFRHPPVSSPTALDELYVARDKIDNAIELLKGN